MIKVIKSVVVATEEPGVIHELSGILLQHDYSIIIEKSTIKSMLKILEQEIYFLFLDIDVPKNSNMDLITIIRRTRPRLPIVVMSQDNSVTTRRSLAEAGVFYYLLKPIRAEEIEQVLHAVDRYYQKQGEIKSLIYQDFNQYRDK